MEEFLLDILGWEHSEGIWLFKLFTRFKLNGNSFLSMCEEAGANPDDCIFDYRVDPEPLETVFLSNLFIKGTNNVDFKLSDDIITVQDLILETNHGKNLNRLYDEKCCKLTYDELTVAKTLILELEEFYVKEHSGHNSQVTNNQINIPESSTLIAESIFERIYGSKTSRR